MKNVGAILKRSLDTEHSQTTSRRSMVDFQRPMTFERNTFRRDLEDAFVLEENRKAHEAEQIVALEDIEES